MNSKKKNMYGGDRVYPLSSHDDDENVSRLRENALRGLFSSVT